MSKVSELVNYKPSYIKYEKGVEKEIFYEVSFYCESNKLIHPNLKSVLKCDKCISELDRIEYEAKQRLKWFIDGYFTHNLGNTFSKITTEEICNTYNVKMSYFRPHL